MGRDGHLEETLRRIIAHALVTEVQDPRVGFVTISEVRVSRDRTMAQVYYTVMGDEDERATTLEGLKRVRGFLRQKIGDQTRLRNVPDLRFRYDDSLDRSFRVEAMLDEISAQSPPADAATGEDDDTA